MGNIANDGGKRAMNEAQRSEESGLTDLLSSGFESAERLIGYCEIHCETPRALFYGKQVNDMLKLAGHPDGWVLEVDENEWFSIHDEMAELCKLARAQLAG